MELKYKPDWEEAQERYRAWWQHDALDRCGLWVTAPKHQSSVDEPPTQPEDPIVRWTDLDYISEFNDYRLRNIFFGGESFPCWNGGYPGHTALPSFLGCPTHLDHRTGWWDPILTDEKLEFEHLTINEDNDWWKFTLKLLHRAAQECRGKSIPSIGAFGGCGDTLAALRGTDRLLMDVIDQPEQVIAAENYLMDMWIDVYDKFYEIIKDAADGTTCWFPLWVPGKFYATQNDFSYMISPEMFKDLFIPIIEKQTEFLDYSVYHVDGIEAFRHVPALCELPKLQSLQILPGAGKPSPLHYMDTLKYVQKAGKNLHISIPINEVETALSELSSRGLFIATSCKTESEAKDLLKKAKKWSKD